MNKKKILLVDDEMDTLLVVGKQLTDAGYAVITTDKGIEALDLAKSQQPDLIILDIQMPGIDGVEVAHRLTKDPATKNIPVAFLTCLLSESETYDRDDKIMIAKSKDTSEMIVVIDSMLASRGAFTGK